MIGKFLAPLIKPLFNDITKQLEHLMDSVAEEKAIAPHELHFLIQKVDKKATGYVVRGEEKLTQTDLTAIINQSFEPAFEKAPFYIKNWLTKKMGDNGPSELIVNLLNEGSLVLRYNEDDELEYFTRALDGKETKVSIDDFMKDVGGL